MLIYVSDISTVKEVTDWQLCRASEGKSSTVMRASSPRATNAGAKGRTLSKIVTQNANKVFSCNRAPSVKVTISVCWALELI